jgi:hypothetical protein
LADSDLTLAATAALELGVDAADPRLPRAIGAASDAIRGHLRRGQLHRNASIVEKVAGFGRARIVLNVTPIVNALQAVLPDGSVLTFAAGDFTVEDADAGFLYRRAGWPYTGFARGGLPPANEPTPGSETPLITVTYAGGWQTPAQGGTRTLPYDIEQACLQLVTNIYRGGGQAENVAAESLGAYSVTYADRARVGLLSPSVQQLLAPYVRHEG